MTMLLLSLRYRSDDIRSRIQTEGYLWQRCLIGILHNIRRVRRNLLKSEDYVV